MAQFAYNVEDDEELYHFCVNIIVSHLSRRQLIFSTNCCLKIQPLFEDSSHLTAVLDSTKNFTVTDISTSYENDASFVGLILCESKMRHI